MSEGFILINSALIGRKKPGKRKETDSQFHETLKNKVSKAITLANSKGMEVIFHGGFVENPKDLKSILSIINLLKMADKKVHILLNQKERLSLKHEDQTVFGVIRTLELANLVDNDGFIYSECNDASVFYVSNYKEMPMYIESSMDADHTYVILGSPTYEPRKVEGVKRVVVSSQEPLEEIKDETQWISLGSLVRRSQASKTMPIVTTIKGSDLKSLQVSRHRNVFLDEEVEESAHGLVELMDESAFVEKLREGSSEIEAITETDLIEEVNKMTSDKKYSEASREILQNIFKDTLYSEMSEFI